MFWQLQVQCVTIIQQVLVAEDRALASQDHCIKTIQQVLLEEDRALASQDQSVKTIQQVLVAEDKSTVISRPVCQGGSEADSVAGNQTNQRQIVWQVESNETSRLSCS